MSITIDQSSVVLEVGDAMLLVAFVEPDNASESSVIWAGDNASVVTVDNQGNILALTVGEVIISATTADGSFVAEVVIEVIETTSLEVTDIRLDFDSLNLEVGETAVLNPSVLPENAVETTIAPGKTIVRGTTSNGVTIEVVIEVNAQELLMVYPNPAEDFISISGVK